MFYELEMNKGDEPIAVLMEKHPSKSDKQKLLYYKKHELDSKDLKKEFIINNEDKLMPLMMSHEGYPNRAFLAGGTLSGKTWLADKMAMDYHLQFPKNKIILFSWVEDDDNYKHFKKMNCFHKIRIDDSILDNPIQLNELHDSCCIFDDIEHFADKDIRAELERLRDSCINAGRHSNIAVIVARQNLLEASKTKTALNSSFQIISFPHSGSRFQLGQFLRRHMHLENKKVQRILNLPSRWVLINRQSPPFVLHEKGCFLLD